MKTEEEIRDKLREIVERRQIVEASEMIDQTNVVRVDLSAKMWALQWVLDE